MTLHTAYISVGSNLGEKLSNCRRAIVAIDAHDDCSAGARSPFYRTEPVDYEDQDWFVNAAVRIDTRLDPVPLLEMLQQIQRGAGRVKDPVRFGPRVLDLDIVLYDQMIVQTPRLVIPHPRMHKRRFVLQPICDINPLLNHPVFNQTMQALLSEIDADSQKIVPIDA